MAQFIVTSACAPGLQFDGVFYKPGETVVIPADRKKDLPFSLVNDKPVYDKLYPVDDEALVMIGQKPAAKPVDPAK